MLDFPILFFLFGLPEVEVCQVKKDVWKGQSSLAKAETVKPNGRLRIQLRQRHHPPHPRKPPRSPTPQLRPLTPDRINSPTNNNQATFGKTVPCKLSQKKSAGWKESCCFLIPNTSLNSLSKRKLIEMLKRRVLLVAVGLGGLVCALCAGVPSPSL